LFKAIKVSTYFNLQQETVFYFKRNISAAKIIYNNSTKGTESVMAKANYTVKSPIFRT
jgi:hypothetical protein